MKSDMRKQHIWRNPNNSTKTDAKELFFVAVLMIGAVIIKWFLI